jgi:hypothetical protein
MHKVFSQFLFGREVTHREGFLAMADYSGGAETYDIRDEEGHVLGRDDTLRFDRLLVDDPNGNRRGDCLENLKQVIREWVDTNFLAIGIPVIYYLHDPHGADEPNYHAHVISVYRALGPEGFSQERKRPRGKEWLAWISAKESSLLEIQTRHLQRLGVECLHR